MTAKAVVEIEMIDSKAQNTLGGLNEKLQRLRDRIDDVEVGSDAFKKLATEIQKTSSQVKTLEKEMEGLEPQQKAEAFLKMGEGIMGGFVAAQGALTMVGVESENLEKLQTRVQGAIAIAMGVRMMSEAALMATTAKRVALEKLAIAQTTLGVKLHGMAAKAALLYTKGLKAIGISAKVSAGGMKILKVAIASTGIGLLVVAIGTIAAYWDDIKGALTGVSSEMRDQLASATATKDAAIANMEATEGSVNQLKLAGMSQREILDLKIKDIDAAIQASEIEMERQRSVNKSQVETAKRNKEILKGILEFLLAPMDMLVELYNDIVYYIPGVEQMTLPSEFFADKVFDPDEVKEEGEELLNEMDKNINALKEKRAGFELSIIQMDKQAAEKRRAAREEEQKKLEDAQKELDDAELAKLEELINAKMQLEQEYYDSLLSEEQRAYNEIERKYLDKIELAKEYGLDTTDLEAARLAEIQAVNDRFREEERLKDEEDLEAKKTARDAFVQAVGDSVGQISGLLAEGSKGAKAAALAEIAINTGLGFIQGLDIAQKSAKATGPGAALAFPIFYATQIAAVLGAVKKARSAIGAGGGGETAPVVPTQSAPTRSGNFTLNASQSPEIVAKTFVVADEMTDQQSQLADIRRRATI
jgi:hypothetical protein